MSAHVVFTPRPPHRCELPSSSDYRPGTIVRCDTCRRYHRRQPVAMWSLMAPAEVVVAIAQGKIPMQASDERTAR